MAKKIPATGRWADGSKINETTKGIMIRTGGPKKPIKKRLYSSASPEVANEIMTERRKSRAIEKHAKEGHEDTLEDSALNRFLYGKKGRAKVVKHESDKKKAEHIDKKMQDSKRTKKYENQK
jgi:hypothetical protein